MSGVESQLDIDWQVNKSLLDCSTQLCLRSHLSDVTFCFPAEHVRLPAHKLILSLRSPVFETMFYGSIPADETVSIVDIPSAAFKSLLKFIYTDRFEFEDSQEALDTMQAAYKYQIPLLADICASNLESSIQIDNVCSILDEAILFGLGNLKLKCLNFIDKFCEEIIRSDNEDFLGITVSCLEFILERDNIFCDEYEIYKAAVSWAKQQCSQKELEETGANMREVLGKAFFNIRITNIPLQIFVDKISRDPLFSENEIIQIFRYFNSTIKSPLEFLNCKARRERPDVTISRMQGGLRRSNDKKAWRCETIKFLVSKPAMLTSLGLLNVAVNSYMDDEIFGNRHLVAIEITDAKRDGTAADSDSDDDYSPRHRSSNDNPIITQTFSTDSQEQSHFLVKLPKPIPVIGNCWYRVDINMFSFNKQTLNSVIKTKTFSHVVGSAITSKVTLDSGFWAMFEGLSSGPIHSLHLKPEPPASSSK